MRENNLFDMLFNKTGICFNHVIIQIAPSHMEYKVVDYLELPDPHPPKHVEHVRPYVLMDKSS